jgi:hypothetical protein
MTLLVSCVSTDFTNRKGLAGMLPFASHATEGEHGVFDMSDGNFREDECIKSGLANELEEMCAIAHPRRIVKMQSTGAS